MLQILKEEFLDLVMISSSDNEEFRKLVSEKMRNPKLASILSDMYASKKWRGFARSFLVGVAILNVINQRKLIKDQDIYMCYKSLEEQLI